MYPSRLDKIFEVYLLGGCYMLGCHPGIYLARVFKVTFGGGERDKLRLDGCSGTIKEACKFNLVNGA